MRNNVITGVLHREDFSDAGLIYVMNASKNWRRILISEMAPKRIDAPRKKVGGGGSNKKT